MKILVDRDSVHAGDDHHGHERFVEVADDATIEQLLRTMEPDVHVHGGSTWVCHWNGTPFAVHASSWGRGQVWDPRYRTLSDLLDTDPADTSTFSLDDGSAGGPVPHLKYHYWQQVDPDWLLEQLSAGHPPHPSELRAEWNRIAQERTLAAWRAHEPFVVDPLLDAETVQLLVALGARVDVHVESVCRLFVGEELWTVQRSYGLVHVRTPHGGRGRLRAAPALPVWLVTLIGSTLVGARALPDPVMRTTVERRHRPHLLSVRDPAIRAPAFPNEPELAQFDKTPGAGKGDVALFRQVVGRTAMEIAAVYLTQPPPNRPGGPEEHRRYLASWWSGMLDRWATGR